MRSQSSAPTARGRRAAGAVRPRRLAALPLALFAGLGAACGGDGTTSSGANATTTNFVFATSAALAQGTTGPTLRVAPTYERTSGERVALAAQSANLAGATQSVPVTVDLASCLADAARRGAEQGAGAPRTCVVYAAVTLQAGGRTLDSVAVGPFTVKPGDQTAATVSFVEVASVSVTREGGAAVGAQPVPLQVGQTLDLAGTAVGANGSAVARAVGFTSTAPTVATVDPNTGVVTAAAIGTARIVAAAGGREAGVDVVVQPTLAVTLAGVGAGSVTSAPAGITCAAAGAAGCTAAFAPGASVTLTATPDANSTFAGWQGCTGTGATCTVALDQARAVTATFARRRVALTVTVASSGAASGSVLVTGGNVAPATPCAPAAGQTAACAYTVDAGRTVNLTATAGAASRTGTWSGACAGPATQACAITPTADVAAGVTFAPPPTSDTVSVGLVGPAATPPLGGQVGISGFVNGQPTATQFSFVVTTASPLEGLAFDPGSPVTFRFAPNAQTRTTGWGGLCAGAGARDVVVDATGVSTCTVTSTRSTQVSLTVAPR